MHVIVWLFVGVVAVVLALASYSLYVMSAGRAYVAGEGMWSKAQKQAVQALARYTLEGRPEDWTRYESSLAVIMGDRQARLELEKPEPDVAVAVRGFLQGRNHPEDIDGMIMLFRTFRHMAEIDRAIGIWSEADAHVDALVALAREIRDRVEAEGPDPDAVRLFLQRLDDSDQALTPLEDAFSQALGEATRKSYGLLQALLLGLVTVLLVVALWISMRLARHSAQYHRALQHSENQLRTLLRFAPLPILIVRGSDGVLVYANERACARLAIPEDGLGRLHVTDFYVRPAERAEVLRRLQDQARVQEFELELQDRQGLRFWALLSAQRLMFQGESCTLSALTDIDERRRAQQELQHRAFHDELTGLANRAMFMESLGRTRHRVERRGGSFYLLFVDLDGFKGVNDNHGHRVGDQLLREVALRLRLCVREGDLVSRLGGDEFVVLVESDDTLEDIGVIAHKILGALLPPYLIDGITLRMTASVGIARYPHDGTELGELMRRADQAMYDAKAAGRNTYRFSGTPS